MSVSATLNDIQNLQSFDANPSLEVRGAFLHISKTFNRIWQDDLLYKLKLLEISGRYYNLM